MNEQMKKKVSTVFQVHIEFHTELLVLSMFQALLQYMRNALSSTLNNHTSSIWSDLPSLVKSHVLQMVCLALC